MLTLFCELVAVASASSLALIVGLPFVIWFDKAKKEMSEKWNE